MSEPADIVAWPFVSEWGGEGAEMTDDDTEIGVKALRALHADGWRIVKTEDAGAYDPPDGFDPGDEENTGTDWDRSGVFYEDENRPEGCVPLVKVTEEWKP